METKEFWNFKIFKNSKDVYNSEFLLVNDQKKMDVGFTVIQEC